MSAPQPQHHEINYIEFTVTDMERAQRFYRESFGWEFTDYAPQYAGIRRSDGTEAGGFSLGSEVTRGGPLVILYSDDLESTLALVRDAGGSITRPIFDFPGGRRFHFKDLEGNELAAWSEG